MSALNDRVTLFRRADTVNSSGTLSDTEVVVAANIAARVSAMSGSERDSSRQTEARANYVVRVRRQPSLTEAAYVRWRGQVGNIRFIPDEGPRQQFVDLEVEFGAP